MMLGEGDGNFGLERIEIFKNGIEQHENHHSNIFFAKGKSLKSAWLEQLLYKRRLLRWRKLR